MAWPGGGYRKNWDAAQTLQHTVNFTLPSLIGRKTLHVGNAEEEEKEKKKDAEKKQQEECWELPARQLSISRGLTNFGLTRYLNNSW